MDLSEFLLARIAEDEAVARRNIGDRGLGDDGFFPDYRTYGDADTAAADDFLHRFTPPRILAECDAKRRVVEEFERIGSLSSAEMPDGGVAAMAILDGIEIALRALALPYADHEQFQEEWRP